ILVLGTDPLHSSPILDLRVRKAIRRNGARLLVATERPTALDGGAEAIARFAPGQAAHFVGELTRALGGEETVGTPLAETLREAGRVVVLWGERIGAEAQGALLGLAAALRIAETDGAGLLEIPEFANARGLREAGCLPDAAPGLAATEAGMGTERIRAALQDRELAGLILVGVDPLRDFPDSGAWEEALNAAGFVVALSTFETATAAKADVLFPLETHAEKDGTVTHPDGRLQRVRPSAGRPGDIRPGFLLLSELAEALGLTTGVYSQPTAFEALREAVPFYADVTDELIGGKGIRWQETEAAANAPAVEAAGAASSEASARPKQVEGVGAGSADTQPGRASDEPAPAPSLALGTYRDLWAGPITELNPPLRFLKPQQRLEVSVADAERLELQSGDRVRVGRDGAAVEARVVVRERVPNGVCFLAEGVAPGNANALRNGGPARVEIEKLSEVPA
ncbi:MAG: molybdopterin oxidoreductase family protein, partial [Syntrophothermus sp.]